MDHRFLRITEVAEILGICKSFAYQLVASGQIPSVRIAGRKSIRVPAQGLQKWIEDQMVLGLNTSGRICND